MRLARFLISTLLALAPLLAAPTETPHDNSFSGGFRCDSCHMGHNAGGSGLTKNTDGVTNLCQSCHTILPIGSGHGLPSWPDTTMAQPGVSGTSHKWNAVANSIGATPPPAPMGSYLDTNGGTAKLTCAVCHDPHNNTGRAGGSQYTSYTIGVPVTVGSGTLTLASVASDAAAKGYVVQILTGGTAFKVSNDNGGSWFGCPTSSDYTNYLPALPAPDATQYPCSVPATAGTLVSLNDLGGKVKVIFGGTQAAGNQWKFTVSYPFIRVSNTDSAMCVVCHPDRNMTHTRVAGQDPSYLPNGSNVFSHPVGESLNANAGGYDRGTSTTSSVLDANGGVQGSATYGATASATVQYRTPVSVNSGGVHLVSVGGRAGATQGTLTPVPSGNVFVRQGLAAFVNASLDTWARAVSATESTSAAYTWGGTSAGSAIVGLALNPAGASAVALGAGGWTAGTATTGTISATKTADAGASRVLVVSLTAVTSAASTGAITCTGSYGTQTGFTEVVDSGTTSNQVKSCIIVLPESGIAAASSTTLSATMTVAGATLSGSRLQAAFYTDVAQTLGSPDAIASNNLKLGTNNTVHCMTCHSPHLADSNSLTELP